MKTAEEYQALIVIETQLIAELEAKSVPKVREETYHPLNTPYHQHQTKISDAYWRRRNWRHDREAMIGRQ